MEESNKFTPYDEKMQTRELQLLKTMVPYMSGTRQKQIAIFIQYLELQNTLKLFSGSKGGLAICEIPEGADRRSSMLNAMRQYCSPKEQETIDMLLNMFSILDNYELFLK